MKTFSKKQFIGASLISFILIMTGLILMINSTLAIDIPDVLDHLPTSEDLDSLHLVSGRYIDTKVLTSDNSSLAIKYMVKMPTKSLRIMLPNEFIRAEVLEYDKDYNYIGLTDLATYDYFTKNDNTEYLLFSFYKSDEYGEKVDSSFEELTSLFDINNFTFEEIDDMNTEEMLNRDATAHAYLSHKSLINGANLKMGATPKTIYKQVSYTYNEKNATLRQYYKVVPGSTYYLSINDSRMYAHVYWLTDTGLMKSAAFSSSGSSTNTTIKVPNGIYAIALTYQASTNAQKETTTYDMIFNHGARIAISPNEYYYNGTQSIDAFPNIQDVNMWREGSYGYSGGEFYAIGGSYASISYYTQVPNDEEYIFRSANNFYTLKVIEVDNENQKTAETVLTSDMHVKFRSDTVKFALVINRASKIDDDKYIDFLNAIENGLDIVFEKYVPYQYNTVMRDISNKEMIQEMGIGWNLGNSLDSKKGGDPTESTQYNAIETAYGNPYVAENVIEYVKSLGFKTIRIPITYKDNWYYDQNGNYIIREEFLDRIQEVVNYAIKRDLYVIINTHFDSGISSAYIYLGDESFDYERAKKYSKDIWTQIANRFRDYDEHLMFEGYNEVDNLINGRLCTPIAGAQMNEINQLFVDTVRNTGGNNEKRILQIQTFTSNPGVTALNAFQAPKDLYPNKIIAQVHWYPNIWDEKVEEVMKLFDAFTERTGLPITIGETSLYQDTSPTMYKYTIMSNLAARTKKHNIAIIIWDNNGDRKLVDRKYLTVDQVYLDSIMNNYEYTGPEMTWITDYSDFKQVKYSSSDGSYVEKYDGWGTIMSKPIPIEPNKRFVRVTELNYGEADQRYIHVIFFYDENDKGIPDQSLYNKYPGIQDAYLAVPENAAYFRVVLLSSHYKTTDKDYQRYFDNGLLKVGYAFETPEYDHTIEDTPINSNEVKLTKMSDFKWGTLYSDDGRIQINTWWYAVNTSYIEIPEGSTKLNVRYYTQGFGNRINFHDLAFYDENKQFISSEKSVGEYDIPQNAKYVILGLNGSDNYTQYKWAAAFASGDIALIYGFE